MQTTPEAYADSIGRQARSTPDAGLVHLLAYASRGVVAGSQAAAISAAETEAVAAEYKRRGLAFPFWFRTPQEA